MCRPLFSQFTEHGDPNTGCVLRSNPVSRFGSVAALHQKVSVWNQLNTMASCTGATGGGKTFFEPNIQIDQGTMQTRVMGTCAQRTRLKSEAEHMYCKHVCISRLLTEICFQIVPVVVSVLRVKFGSHTPRRKCE